MRIAAVAVSLSLALGTAYAQRHTVTINAETPEGHVLQQIGSEVDEAKKLGLMEQFAAQHPKHEGILSVYEMLIPAYTKAGNFDAAMMTAEKLLAADPEDMDSAHAALKAAEAKKDPDAVLKWSNTTSTIARKMAASPKPTDEDEVEGWKNRVDYAKQMDVYTEYAIFAAVLQTTDPQKRILLGQGLERRNPDSKYFVQVAEQYFLALMQTGKTSEAVEFGERAVAKNAASPEMLLAVASGYITKRQPEKTLDFAQKATAAAAARPKPEGVNDADWQARQAALVGRAKWISGVTYAGQSKWALADTALRAALPAVQSDKDMLAEALFYLGLANYRLAEAGETERIKDALQFTTQCAAIPGRFQGPANTNIKAIRSQYRVK